MRILALLIALPIAASAAPDYQSILEANETRREALKDEARDTASHIRDLTQQVRELERTIKAQEEQLDPMDRDFVGVRFPRRGQAEEWGKIKDRLDRAKADKKKIEDELKALRKAREDMDKEMDRLSDSSREISKAQKEQAEKAEKDQRKLERKLAERVEKLEEELKNAKVGKTIDELDNKLENIEDTLDRLENVWDRGLMGSYMKRKMERLMSSDGLCQGVKQCSSGSNTGEKIPLDVLFNPESRPSSSTQASAEGAK